MLSDRFLSYSKKGLAEITTHCHSLSLIVPLAVTRCHSLYHLLSFTVTCFHSLSRIVPAVVTWCITRLSFYKHYIFSKIDLTIIGLSFFFVLGFPILCDRSKSFGKIYICISSLTVLMIMLSVSSSFSSFFPWKRKRRQFLREYCACWSTCASIFYKSSWGTDTWPRKLLIISPLSFLSASNSWNFSERKLTVS